MRIVYGAKKRAVIALWCLAVSLFLWYFAIAMNPEIDFYHFFNFCILLFGSGFAYHIVTELVSCPYEESNSHQWNKIFIALLYVYIGYLIAGISLAIGKLIGKGVGWLIAFCGLLFGMFWALHFLTKLNHPIWDLLFNRK